MALVARPTHQPRGTPTASTPTSSPPRHRMATLAANASPRRSRLRAPPAKPRSCGRPRCDAAGRREDRITPSESPENPGTRYRVARPDGHLRSRPPLCKFSPGGPLTCNDVPIRTSGLQESLSVDLGTPRHFSISLAPPWVRRRWASSGGRRVQDGRLSFILQARGWSRRPGSRGWSPPPSPPDVDHGLIAWPSPGCLLAGRPSLGAAQPRLDTLFTVWRPAGHGSGARVARSG